MPIDVSLCKFPALVPGRWRTSVCLCVGVVCVVVPARDNLCELRACDSVSGYCCAEIWFVCLLLNDIATIFQLHLGSDMMCISLH